MVEAYQFKAAFNLEVVILGGTLVLSYALMIIHLPASA
jgi:hypothetical protein